MSQKVEVEYLGAKIPRKLNQEVNDAVYRGDYISKSDLVRCALRQLLKKEA